MFVAGVMFVVVAILVIVSGGWYIFIDRSAGQLVAALRDKNEVKAVITRYSWVVQWVACKKLRTVVTDDELRKDRNKRMDHARYRANCAFALHLAGSLIELEQLLSGPSDLEEWYDPEARTFAILYAVSPAGIPPEDLLLRLEESPNEPRLRQALILALGQSQVLLASDRTFPRQRLRKVLLKLFGEDDDPGVHAAAWWCLLRKFPDEETLKELRNISADLRKQGIGRLGNSRKHRSWFVDRRTGLTMVVLDTEGREGVFGNRDIDRQQTTFAETYRQRIRLRRSFAIAMTEVNRAHSNGEIMAEVSSKSALTKMSWEQAKKLCVELGSSPTDERRDADRPASSGVQFRLPNELEWEYACRAGSEASYSFGDNVEHLSHYATGVKGGGSLVLLGKMPNDFGLFDMHGGVGEWCSNDPVVFPPDQEKENLGATSAIFRGGDEKTLPRATEVTAHNRNYYSKKLRFFPIGIRPAATISVPAE